MPLKRFPTQELLIILAIGLFILNVVKAVRFPLTHDEAISFFIFNGQPFWESTANNHLLNTLFMRVSSAFFGYSEWVLRLPNILAHVVYLIFSIFLSLRLSKPLTRIGCFVFLNFNLFAFDFFSLARGYGLAMSFELASVYFLIRTLQQDKPPHFRWSIYFSLGAGILAAYANSAFVNFFIPLWIVLLGMQVLDISGRKIIIRRQHLPHFVFLFIIGVAVIADIGLNLMELRARNELYFGGTSGLVNDTLKSLIEASLYTSIDSNQAISILMAVILILIIMFYGLSIYLLVKHHTLVPFHWLVILFSGVILLPIFQHTLFEVRFPIERTALFYFPLFGILLAQLLDLLIKPLQPAWLIRTAYIFSSVVTLVLAGYFFMNFRFSTCYSWGFDASNKAVIQTIASLREEFFPDETISVGINWIFEPSLNYYRAIYNYSWLTPFNREGIDIGENHFIYTFLNEVPDHLPGYELIQTFPQTNTVLLRKANSPN